MRVVSLEPFLTEAMIDLGLGENLVAISHRCAPKDEALQALPRVTLSKQNSRAGRLSEVSKFEIDYKKIRELAPDLVIGSILEREDDEQQILEIREALRSLLAESTKFRSYVPKNFEQVLEFYARMGKDVGAEAQGLSMAGKMKAQAMDWCDNFYERMKNKRVTFLSSIEPLSLAGYWIPDMIHLCSAVSQQRMGGKPDQRVEWREVLNFRPDVIVVAPRGTDLQSSALSFKKLQKLPDWEDVIAVKRGDVYFADGDQHFYQPTAILRESMGILVSAVASLESGYITARDSFFKLRWIELHRHKFGG